VLGAKIEETDALPDGRVALHFLPALRTLVQLIPSILRRLVAGHERTSE